MTSKDFINDLEQTISEYDCVELLKRYSNNYDLELLASLKEDLFKYLDFYIVCLKEEMQKYFIKGWENTGWNTEDSIITEHLQDNTDFYKIRFNTGNKDVKKYIDQRLILLETIEFFSIKKGNNQTEVIKIIDKIQNGGLLENYNFANACACVNIINNKITKSQPVPDFSVDTEPKEKLILLNELGVIDFLKSKAPFNTSTNAMATALSGILGIKQKTLQSYLNPMFSPNAGQRNNPYENKELVQKAQQKLISIGYEVKNQTPTESVKKQPPSGLNNLFISEDVPF